MLLSTLSQKSPSPISQDDVEEEPPPHAPTDCLLVTNRQVVITKLRATDLTASLRRIPAGFYISISLGDNEWRTSNKPVCLTGGATEWDDLIYLPSDLSCVVYVRVYASFELGHMLGRGQLLRKLSITVGELLERSNVSRPIIFSTKEGEVVSSCSSLEVTAELRSCQDLDEPIIRPPTKHNSHGHYHLKEDPNSFQLDTTVMHFHHLVDSCPFPHPALSTSFSNLSVARFLGCRDHTMQSTPIALHREALNLGTAGYPSHLLNLIDPGVATLSMLIIIVTILLPLFPSRRCHVDVVDTEESRTEVPEICSPSFQDSKPTNLSGAVIFATKAKPRSQDEAFLAQATDIGHGYMLRYHSNSDMGYLDRAIMQFQSVLDRCPSRHPGRSAALSNLAMARFISCQTRGAYLDLGVPIALYEEALDLRPANHPDRLSTLINFSIALLTRFHRMGYRADAEQAEEFLTSVLEDSLPDGHEYRSVVLVAQTFIMGIEGAGFSHIQPASINSPGSHLPYSLDQLYQLVAECQERDDPQLLDDAISRHHDAESYYVGQPEWVPLQVNLSAALVTRFRRQGRELDLDEAIRRGRAIVLQPTVGDQRRASLTTLAIALQTRFEHRGGNGDLDEAIQHHRDALLQVPVGHPDHPLCLVNLGSALATRFEYLHIGNDLDEAIQLFRDALLLMPVGHTHRWVTLNNLSGALCTRFQLRSDDNDLDEAIQGHRDALLLMRIETPDRPASLTNLANALQTRFTRQGDGDDLDEAIKCCRDALLLRPVGNPYRSASLNNLANALRARFELQGEVHNLDEALQHHTEALLRRPAGHLDHLSSLMNISLGLRTRFERLGIEDDVDRAVQYCRDALLLTPPGHPHRAKSLNSLAETLSERFQRLGDWSYLDEATKHSQDALLLTPVGSPNSSTSLNTLATVLMVRFDQRGDKNDVDEAIQHYRDALLMRPVGHPARSISLSNLANALYRRFEHRGDMSDLDEAIQHLRDSLLLTPARALGYPASLNSLAIALRARFERQLDRSDLDEAIQRCRDTLPLVPVGHPNRSTMLDTLGSALSARSHLGLEDDRTDLDEGIQCYRDAVSLKLAKHPNYLIPTSNLANALLTRFKWRGDRSDADEALQLCHSSQNQTPSNCRSRWAILYTLARIYLHLWEAWHVEEHLRDAMHHYEAAASFEYASPLLRLQASMAWIRGAELHQHPSALDAYARALQLLDCHISTSAAVQSRHDVMKHFPTNIAVNAASCALRRGDILCALELLEQGRAILWTQIARFRTPLDDLLTRGSRAEMLVKKFRDLSSALDSLGQLAEASSTQNIPKATADIEARRYQILVDDWNGVVEEIRTFDGFSRFLLPPLFSDLQEAACEGPVIVLLGGGVSCDAIIVLHEQSPIHIQLEITPEELARLVEQHRENISLRRPDREVFLNILRVLWAKVASPVVVELERIIPRRSRVWWCPTSLFTVFPLHASGQHWEGGISFPRRYVSSYTPSLSALVKARRAKRSPPPVSFAAIGQATPDGQPVSFRPLEFVESELDKVETRLPLSSVVFKKLTSSESTRRETLLAFQENHWLHLSCHGMQNFAEPFKSFLAMRDGPLSLLDIINVDLSLHEFAFLSACETAMGELDTPDEAIHLAAGLQFSGVKSVIGSLWTVGDEVACMLTARFYEELCAQGRMDCTMAARALHEAVRALAKEGVPIEYRMVFVHIGI